MINFSTFPKTSRRKCFGHAFENREVQDLIATKLDVLTLVTTPSKEVGISLKIRACLTDWFKTLISGCLRSGVRIPHGEALL